jgi:hypothetical protein
LGPLEELNDIENFEESHTRQRGMESLGFLDELEY